MANNLKTEKKIAVLSGLAEGMSIRSIERMTEVHPDTIMRLGVQVGKGCEKLLDQKMRNLPSQILQLDELWGFIGKKQKNLKQDDRSDLGDVWTFVAIDAETKVVPCYRVGKRTAEHASRFVDDLAGRLANRVQISSDALKAYVEAVQYAFGADVDYGQIVKWYETTEGYPEGKYSPPKIVNASKTIVIGSPDEKRISTSYVERQNLTMRMHIRRLTRLTNGFSKKLENFKAAVALHFAYYNFVKPHRTLRMTPAMAAGIERDFWTVADLIEETT